MPSWLTVVNMVLAYVQPFVWAVQATFVLGLIGWFVAILRDRASR